MDHGWTPDMGANFPFLAPSYDIPSYRITAHSGHHPQGPEAMACSYVVDTLRTTVEFRVGFLREKEHGST